MSIGTLPGAAREQASGGRRCRVESSDCAARCTRGRRWRHVCSRRDGGGVLRPRQDRHRQGVDGRVRPAVPPARASSRGACCCARCTASSSTCTSAPARRSWRGCASRLLRLTKGWDQARVQEIVRDDARATWSSRSSTPRRPTSSRSTRPRGARCSSCRRRPRRSSRRSPSTSASTAPSPVAAADRRRGPLHGRDGAVRVRAVQGRGHARARRGAGHRPGRVVRVLRLLHRRADARGRRPPVRGEPRPRAGQARARSASWEVLSFTHPVRLRDRVPLPPAEADRRGRRRRWSPRGVGALVVVAVPAASRRRRPPSRLCEAWTRFAATAARAMTMRRSRSFFTRRRRYSVSPRRCPATWWSPPPSKRVSAVILPRRVRFPSTSAMSDDGARGHRPVEGQAGRGRRHRRPRSRAGRGGGAGRRRAASATPTCTTARAGSTTTSRSSSVTRRRARSRRWATGCRTWRRATTSSSRGARRAGLCRSCQRGRPWYCFDVAERGAADDAGRRRHGAVARARHRRLRRADAGRRGTVRAGVDAAPGPRRPGSSAAA